MNLRMNWAGVPINDVKVDLDRIPTHGVSNAEIETARDIALARFMGRVALRCISRPNPCLAFYAQMTALESELSPWGWSDAEWCQIVSPVKEAVHAWIVEHQTSP